MAKENKQNWFGNLITKTLSNLRQNSSFLPSSITNDSEYIKNQMDDVINKLSDHNEEEVGDLNIANLYARLYADNPNGPSNGMDNVNFEELLSSTKMTEALLPSFMENREIVLYREQIDLILKYYPKLRDVLNVKKDHVLCADSNNNDFLIAYDEISNTSTNDDESTNKFQSNMELLKKKYDLLNKFEEFYDEATTYGECYVYIDSYDNALGKLLLQKKTLPYNNMYKESVINLSEACSISNNEYIDGEDNFDSLGDYNINLKFSKGPILSIVKEEANTNRILTEANNLNFENSVPNKLRLKGISDGFTNTKKKDESEEKLSVKGCILKSLEAECVIPIYTNDKTFLGAYYVENSIEEIQFRKNPKNYRGNLTAMNSIFANHTKSEKNMALQNLSREISKQIDANFINNNQDLTKEIYAILKNCKFESGVTNLNVTFLPPSKVVPIIFNRDKKSNRGLSDLDMSMVPASIYTSLYTNNAIGIMTRGYDKRVYYVKNKIEKNIHKSLLNVVNQLRKGNMGAREISNPKTALNITGRYHDVVMPVGMSGEAPVSIENIPGQDIDTKPEFMESLEELAVCPTDVPMDYVDQTKTVDFATRLSMSSYKFLRAIMKRQIPTNRLFSSIIQKVYDYEYVYNVDPKTASENRAKITIKLPVPAYLNQMQLYEIYRVTNDMSVQLAESEFLGQNDELVDVKKGIFVAEMNKRVMGSQLDRNLIDSVKKFANIHATKYKEQQE